MPTASRDIIVSNGNGLHARPAMQFVERANGFGSTIRVRKLGDDPVEADGKSLMQMIGLEAIQGTQLRIEAEGEDAADAVMTLAHLFETNFGED